MQAKGSKSGLEQGKSRWEFRYSHALVVGINRYQNDVTPLASAVNDAMAIADVLETQHHYQVTRLLDEAATFDRLKAALATLSQQVPPHDRLLFYFAGHGIARKSDQGPAGYLLPQDAKLADPKTFLSMHGVYDALCSLVHCRHLLLILDCCFAGTFRWANTRKAVVLDVIHREHYDRFIEYPAWEVLTSTASDQEALDAVSDQRGQLADSSHSPFATALLQALSTDAADYTGDRVITGRELYVYLDEAVAKLSREQQTPGYFPLRQDDPKYEKGKYIFTFSGFNRDNLTPAPQLDESQNPYRGLKSFEERHAAFFFGRDALIDQLADRLEQSTCPLISVLGGSGAGKSSLVKAGLLPELRRRQKDQPQQWYILDPMRPGNDLLTALARAMLPVTHPALIDQVRQLQFLDQRFQSLESSEASLANADLLKLLKRWTSASDQARLLIILDARAELRAIGTEAEQQQLTECHRAISEALLRSRDALQQNPAAFGWQIEQWSQQHPQDKLLLVIDQFEELITMDAGRQLTQHEIQTQIDDRSFRHKPLLQKLQQASNAVIEEMRDIFTEDALDQPQTGAQSGSPGPGQWFLAALSQALSTYSNFRVVITLRADFEPRFQNSELRSYWQASRFLMRLMTSDELRLAIEGPALKQALYFDPPELVGRLIDEVGQTPGALPLLSFTLSELYTRLSRRWQLDPDTTERALKQTDYDALGGIAGALTRRAREEYESDGLSEQQRLSMRHLMLRMISIEGSGIARRRVPTSELEYPTPEEDERVKQVLDRLVKARLLVRGQEEVPYVEPAHDILVRGWDELQQWIRQQQELIAIQRRLTPAAEEWQKLERPKNYLWNADPRLPLLAQVLHSKNNWLNKTETEFIGSSVRRRKRNKRIRRGIAAFIVLLLSGIIIYTSLQLQRTELQAKAAKAENLLRFDPVDGLVMMIYAAGENQQWMRWRMLRSVQSALLNAVEMARERTRFQPEGGITAFTFSLDSQWIVTANQLGVLSIWNTQGKLLRSLEGREEPIHALTFSPEGDLIASTAESPIQVWNAQGQPVGRFRADDIISLSYSADRTQSVTGHADGTIRLWDAQGNELKAFRSGTAAVSAVALSPDRRVIASSSRGEIRLWTEAGQALGPPLQTPGFLLPQDQAGNFAASEEIYSLTFSPDGQELIGMTLQGAVELWKQRSPQEPWQFALDLAGDEIFAVFGPQQTLIKVNRSGAIQWQDLASGEAIGPPWLGRTIRVEAVGLSPDQRQLALISNGTMRLWEVQPHEQLNFDPLLGEVMLSPDGRWIALRESTPARRLHLVSMDQKPAAVLDLGNYDQLRSLRTDELLTSYPDGTWQLWNFAGQPQSARFGRSGSTLAQLDLSPDAQTFVSVQRTRQARPSLQLWNRQQPLGQPITMAANAGTTLAFSPDGSLIAINGGSLAGHADSVCLWQVASDRLVARSCQPIDNAVSTVLFSPNGKTVALGDSSGNLYLWDWQANQLSEPVQAHLQKIEAIAFSPDGSKIATKGDSTVRFWDAQGEAMGEPIQAWGISRTSTRAALAFSPQGDRLIVSDGGAVQLWSATWQGWLKIACERLVDHPVLNPPQKQAAKAAKATCERVWK